MDQFDACLQAIERAYWYLPWIFIGSAVVGAILLLAVVLRRRSGAAALVSDGLIAVIGLILMGMGVFQLVKFGGGEQNLEVQFSAGIHEFCAARGENIELKGQVADLSQRLAALEERLTQAASAASRFQRFGRGDGISEAFEALSEPERASEEPASQPVSLEGLEIFVFHRPGREEIASQLVERIRSAGAISAAQVTDLAEISGVLGSRGVRIVFNSGTGGDVLTWLAETIQTLAPQEEIAQTEAVRPLRTGDIQVQIF